VCERRVARRRGARAKRSERVNPIPNPDPKPSSADSLNSMNVSCANFEKKKWIRSFCRLGPRGPGPTASAHGRVRLELRWLRAPVRHRPGGAIYAPSLADRFCSTLRSEALIYKTTLQLLPVARLPNKTKPPASRAKHASFPMRPPPVGPTRLRVVVVQVACAASWPLPVPCVGPSWL
jgi:hypothetical protein